MRGLLDDEAGKQNFTLIMPTRDGNTAKIAAAIDKALGGTKPKCPFTAKSWGC